MTSGESPPVAGEVQGGMTEEEKRENLIRLAFGGQTDRYERFCRAIYDQIPPAPQWWYAGAASPDTDGGIRRRLTRTGPAPAIWTDHGRGESGRLSSS